MFRFYFILNCFLLESSCSTMLCQFLLCRKWTSHVYKALFWLPSHVGHLCRTVGPRLVICFQRIARGVHGNPISQFLLPPAPSPTGTHTLVLYTCVPISAFWIRPSIPCFQIPPGYIIILIFAFLSCRPSLYLTVSSWYLFNSFNPHLALEGLILFQRVVLSSYRLILPTCRCC